MIISRSYIFISILHDNYDNIHNLSITQVFYQDIIIDISCEICFQDIDVNL